MDSQILEISQPVSPEYQAAKGVLGANACIFLILCAQHDLSRTVAATTCSWASALIITCSTGHPCGTKRLMSGRTSQTIN